MSWIFGGGDEDAPSYNSATDMVEALCNRLQSSLPDEHRTAVVGLKRMAKEYKVDVGTRAMDPVLEMLRRDRSDYELTVAAIEMFQLLFASNLGPDGKRTPDDMGVMFSEIFMKNNENVGLLLAVLEEPYPRLQLFTIQVLTELARNVPQKLQNCFLETPQGISRVVDHLSVDAEEEQVRNAVLLLAIELARSNVQIQKILAFDNAFDKLIQIMSTTEYDAVVEDCMRLIHTMLHQNESNQTYFRETRCIDRLAPYLQSTMSAGNLTPHRVKNLGVLFTILQEIVSPAGNPKRVSETQTAMHTCGLLQILCSMCLSTALPPTIVQPVLLTVADAVRGSHNGQAVLATVAEGHAPVILLQIAHDEKRPYPTRCAALYCFQSVVFRNQDMQLKMTSTFLPPPPGESPPTGPGAGQVLCQGLLTGDPLRTWFSSLAFSHILIGNRSAKEATLKVAIAQQGAGPLSLLSVCVDKLVNLQSADAGSERTRAAYLILLIVWLSDCPFAVSVFLDIAHVIDFLVAQLSEASGLGSIVQGLSAVLLSTCLAYSDDTHEGLSKDAVVAKIKNHKEGIDALLAANDKFLNSDVFSTAVKAHKFVAPDPQLYWFDHELAALFRTIVVTTSSGGADGIVSKSKSFVGSPAADQSAKSAVSVDHHEVTTNAYKDLIQSQDAELAILREKLAAVEKGGAVDATTSSGDNSAAVAALQSQVDQLTASVAAHEQKSAELATQISVVEKTLKSTQEERDRLQQQLTRANEAAMAGQTPDEGLKQQLDNAQADLGELHNQVYTLKEQGEAKDAELAELRAAQAASTTDNDALIERQQVIEGLEQTVATLKAQIGEKDSAIEQLKSVETSLSSAAGLSGQLQERVNELETKLSAQPAPVDTSALEAQIRQQQEKLDEQEISIQEHDDLLICLAEQERKLVEYKTKLRDLGQEVSEDEDDDDDDDDDED